MTAGAPERDATPFGPGHGLGKRVRDAREETGMTLRELARRVGVSASLVSQIETDRVLPSVSTLYAIVSELDVSMDAIVFGAVPTAAPGAADREVAPPIHPIIQRAGARDVIVFGSEVAWELLTPFPVVGAEFLYVVYEPGAQSSPAGTYQRHVGREWSVVLAGTLHVSVGFDDYVLGPGDSITYDSMVPHRLSNEGGERVEAVWFQLGELPPTLDG